MYVIGVSHVSKISVRQTRELIAAVSPDVVLLELCRERVDLLIPDTNIDQSDPSLPVSMQASSRPKFFCTRGARFRHDFLVLASLP